MGCSVGSCFVIFVVAVVVIKKIICKKSQSDPSRSRETTGDKYSASVITPASPENQPHNSNFNYDRDAAAPPPAYSGHYPAVNLEFTPNIGPQPSAPPAYDVAYIS